MRRRTVIGAVLLLATRFGAPAPAQSLDPFYASLLHDGELLADQGKALAAAKSLRIACFGMLDAPRDLARCLVRLAVAQSTVGDAAGFRETFSRLLELESRAPAYAAAELPAAVRAAFEQQVAQRIPAPTLATSPTFRALADAGGKEGAKKGKRGKAALTEAPPAVAPPATKPAPPPSPRPDPTAAAPASPTPPPSAASARPPAAAAPSAGGNPPMAPAPSAAAPAPPPAAPAALTPLERATLGAAREKMSAAKVAEDLRAAFGEAKRVADAHPTSVEANALTGEIAYRGSQWPDAVRYLRLAGPPSGQPLLGFYLAVALYETGDRPAAAAVLRPLLSQLQHTPYVEGYARKILPP